METGKSKTQNYVMISILDLEMDAQVLVKQKINGLVQVNLQIVKK